ncbi:hypothetical protein, partial [Actinomadura roseirufa]|uniref:hypothetical protein n=1 Tax=Actinomadura roseirufa TaxID=2094049 RepID=UPI001A955C1E
MCSSMGRDDAESMSTMDLVDAAAGIASELACRDAPDSGAVCMELAESLGRTVDLCESALSGLVARVDVT